MADYQVLPRKYRPKKFKDVVAQDVVVTTLKNAYRFQRLAHAYLFCGPRGTGKTTLARLFAMLLNCPALSEDLEPCNQCPSCREIAAGTSLDVLEIDGASNRGIEDIRQINETVGYSTSSGGEKVYIIDEVHMLTKEAFNALLKTLEEPPPKVKFLFATTEPHKLPNTILSRCQRFNLNRISEKKIIEKLSFIAQDLAIEVEAGALTLIAHRAEGGLRDAESLLDQIHAFHDGTISTADAAAILGVMPRDKLFEFDLAGKEGKLAFAFDLAEELFAQGKDYLHFVEMLTQHFRDLLLIKIGAGGALLPDEQRQYIASADLYTREQCMNILDYLIEMQGKLRLHPSPRIAVETILLHIMRSHRKIPVELLVRKLVELEQKLDQGSSSESKQRPLPPEKPKELIKPPIAEAPPPTPQKKEIKEVKQESNDVTEDPTPEPQELPRLPVKAKEAAPKAPPTSAAITSPSLKTKEAAPKAAPASVEIEPSALKAPSHYDTLIQFAAVELEGKPQKIQIKTHTTE